MKYERIEFFFNENKNLIAIFPFYDINQAEKEQSDELKSINNKLENSIIYKNLVNNYYDNNSNKKLNSNYIKKALYLNSGEYFEEIKIDLEDSKFVEELKEIGTLSKSN